MAMFVKKNTTLSRPHIDRAVFQRCKDGMEVSYVDSDPPATPGSLWQCQTPPGKSKVPTCCEPCVDQPPVHPCPNID